MRSSLEKLFQSEDLLYLGACSPDVTQDFVQYQAWLNEKRHAGMTYLEKHQEARASAEKILSGTQSVLVFGLPYFHSQENKKFQFALYSQFQDYHRLLKSKGTHLVEKIRKDFPGEYRVVVDSAPVLERALAAKTLEGFVGKNTCYIHPRYGSFLLLGEIFTTALFPADRPSRESGCSTCTLCQVECPTGALDEDYRIDSRKCLAYWTIENRGIIPQEFWPHLQEYIFGCDLCQTVCPYNQQGVSQLPPSIPLKKFPGLYEIATMTQEKYEEYFGGTPATRARREGLRRNALIALYMSGDSRLREAFSCIDEDPHPVLYQTRAQIQEVNVQK